MRRQPSADRFSSASEPAKVPAAGMGVSSSVFTDSKEVIRMKRITWAPAVLLALVVGLFPAAGAAAEEQGHGTVPVVQAAERGIPGQYIVVLKHGVNPRSVAAIAGVNPRHAYMAALNGFAAGLNQGQLTALQ